MFGRSLFPTAACLEPIRRPLRERGRLGRMMRAGCPRSGFWDGLLGGLLLALVAGSLWADPKPADAGSPEAKSGNAKTDGGAQPNAHAKPADAKSGDRKAAEQAEDDSAEKLASQQERIADRFKHLEEVLLRMAELNGVSDPRRAALLKKAVAQSKEQLVDIQFERLIELLQKDQLSRAIENQAELDKDLLALLELLLSEDRAKQLAAQKRRYQDYLKQINAIIKEQKNLQGRTAGGERTDRVAGEQGKLAEKTGGLANDMHRGEDPKGKGEKEADEKGKTKDAAKPKGDQQGQGKSPGESPAKGQTEGKAKAKANGEGKSQKKEGQGKEQGKAEGQAEDGAKSAAKNKAKGAAKSKGKGQAPDQGQSEQQAEGPGDQEQDQQNQDVNPARKRLQAAQDRMRQAEEKLKQAQREGAVDKQEEALRELEQAKAELEQILRQLREEEVQRMLAMLEARFKKMLQMQREVYEGTVRLDRVPAAERSQNHEIESGRLSNKEGQIVVEADKARLLLHEDGSSAVFPEALEQVREDMQQVVLRLAQGKVEPITQSIESDIMAALEEMIDAVKKAQKDRDRKKPQQPRPRQGEPQRPPLVDVLAEIKMIRAMQMRVNTRTERYSKLVDGEQAEQAELIQALQRLAEREQRIHRVTRDLELGRNQ